MRGYSRGYGFGLGLLPPPLRLVLAVVLTSAYVYIRTPNVALWIALVSLILVLLNGRYRFGGVFLFVLAVAFLERFVGNTIFSPPGRTIFRFWILHVTDSGFNLGLVGGLKRVAMISTGYATLMSSQYHDFYSGITFFFRTRGCKKWIMCFFRMLQTKGDEIRGLFWALHIRGVYVTKYHPIRWINGLKLLLEAVYNRLFATIDKVTFAGETKSRASSASSGFMLEAKDIKAWYDGREVLGGVSLRVTAGEFILLIGPNGGGKSSFLRILSGYIPGIIGEYEGEVLLNGVSISDASLAEISKTIRYLSDDVSDVIAGLTVGQEMMLGTDSELEARKCLGAMGIDHLWTQETHKLSGGQQTRLTLASILCSKAQLLLLDNPLEPLDHLGRSDFIEALLEFRKNSRATVIVTDHLFWEFMPYVTRYVVLAKGKVSRDVAAPLDISAVLNLTEQPRSIIGLRATTQCGHLLGVLRSVHLLIDNYPVLCGVDLEIHAGEIVALMGPNGSGKTTVAAVLAGLLKPSSGQVISGGPGKIKFLMQDATLHIAKAKTRDQLTVQASLEHWPQAETEKFFTNHLATLGLTGDEDIASLPASILKLLLIADLFATGDIYILDEPSIGLDSSELESLAKYVCRAVEQGKAVLVITHDLRLAQIASRVLWMDKGKIIRETPTVARAIGTETIETRLGHAVVHAFEYGPEQRIALALFAQVPHDAKPLLLRAQLGCVYGTTLQSIDCDCGYQVEMAIGAIMKAGAGVLVYFPEEEGRGHGLLRKMRMITLERRLRMAPLRASQINGNGYADFTSLTYLPSILESIGAHGSFRLVTNSPQKLALLRGVGVPIVEVIPLVVQEDLLSELGRRELSEKQVRLGHGHRSPAVE